MELNWDAIGAIAEGLGALGVIITLLFLIHQIRQNTVAARSSAVVAYSQASISLVQVTGAVENNALFYAYLEKPETLSEDELRRGQAIISMYLHVMEQGFDLYRERNLSEEKWQGRYRQLVWLVTQPGFKNFWAHFDQVYADGFTELVESAMAETPIARHLLEGDNSNKEI